MKKIFTLILFLFCVFGANFNAPIYAINSTEYVRVITQTYVYKTPDIKAELFKNGTDYVVLEIDTILKLDNSSQEDYKLFYRVFLSDIIDGTSENEVAYVLKAHTLDSSINSPEKKLDTNATTNKDNAILYSYDQITDTYNATNTTLDNNTKVRILDGYDKNKEYTYISYQDENNEIMSYYIKTVDLKVEGVNYSLIVGISTLVTCLAIVSIIFGFKAKKKK